MMTPQGETRPERAFYNVEVTLRMVDEFLAELGGGDRLPSDVGTRSIRERVAYALMLVESFGPGSGSPGRPDVGVLQARLRSELRALWRDLHRHGEPARHPDVPNLGRRGRPAPTAVPATSAV